MLVIDVYAAAEKQKKIIKEQSSNSNKIYIYFSEFEETKKTLSISSEWNRSVCPTTEQTNGELHIYSWQATVQTKW